MEMAVPAFPANSGPDAARDVLVAIKDDQQYSLHHPRRACMVPGCSADLSTRYCQVKRVCEAHMKAKSIQRDNSDQLWRFCQQCGKLEPTDAFDGDKRSCRCQLAKRREACARQQAGISTQSQRTNKQPRPSSFALFEQAAPLGVTNTASAPLPALQAPEQVAAMMLQQQQQWAAAGAAGAAPAAAPAGNPLLEQQLQMYREHCAMLRTHIEALEAKHACKQDPSGGLPSSAAGAQHSPSTAADQGALTYTPVFRPTGEPCWGGSCFVSPKGGNIPAEASMGSCTSTGTAYAAAGNTAPLPGVFAGSRSSSVANHGLFSAGGSLAGPSDLVFLDCMQQQQQQAAYTAAAAASDACKLEPGSCIQSAPVNACGFLPADTHGLHPFSSSWACAQQQMMQAPMHVEQMLSAPLPAWGASSTSLPAADPCGPHGGSLLPVFIDRREGPAAGGGGALSAGMAGACGCAQYTQYAQPPLMVLREDGDTGGVEFMDCDSAGDIEDIIEMALLEAGMQARQAMSSPQPV